MRLWNRQRNPLLLPLRGRTDAAGYERDDQKPGESIPGSPEHRADPGRAGREPCHGTGSAATCPDALSTTAESGFAADAQPDADDVECPAGDRFRDGVRPRPESDGSASRSTANLYDAPSGIQL